MLASYINQLHLFLNTMLKRKNLINFYIKKKNLIFPRISVLADFLPIYFRVQMTSYLTCGLFSGELYGHSFNCMVTRGRP